MSILHYAVSPIEKNILWPNTLVTLRGAIFQIIHPHEAFEHMKNRHSTDFCV